jgi:hypothetical protein
MRKNIRLKEAPIDYGDSPERMNPDVERKLATGKTTLSGHLAFPKLKDGLKTKNFEELIASKRFKDIVDRVKRYTGVQVVTTPNAFRNLMMVMMRAYQDVLQIESTNKERLEKLAVELVKREFEIPEGAINFDVKLVGAVSQAGMKSKPEEPEKEEIEQKFKLEDEIESFIDGMEEFELEKSKRRFINSIIQGAAKKGTYLFELVKDELDEINPRLLNLYGTVMSINDTLYWLLEDSQIQGMFESGQSATGTEEVDRNTTPPTIKVRATFFASMMHELVKGVHELLGVHGLPDDPGQQELVLAASDSHEQEIWDLRLGPIIWEKLNEAFPDEVFEEGQKIIQSAILQKFYSLNTRDFHTIAFKIMKGSPEGRKFIQDLVTDIKSEMTKQQFGDLFNDGDDSDDEDDDEGVY